MTRTASTRAQDVMGRAEERNDSAINRRSVPILLYVTGGPSHAIAASPALKVRCLAPPVRAERSGLAVDARDPCSNARCSQARSKRAPMASAMSWSWPRFHHGFRSTAMMASGR
jgi:hypothetical protein